MRTASLLALVTLLLTWSSQAPAAQSPATTKPAAPSPSTTKPAAPSPGTAKPATGGAQPAPAARGTTPVPTAVSVSVPNDYVIGAEDVLGVVFWREADISGDVVVRPDGMITLPLLGEMKAAGVKPDVLREQIRVASGKFLTDPNVTIVVRQINSRKVFITGNVTMPDSYPLTGPRTVLQLISLAGGLTEYANSENISIIRHEGGQTRSLKFNYKDVSKGKKLEQNVVLQPGDTVVVP